MNIDQIARLAGVSSATVSRVINQSDAVRAVTADRVRRMIAEVNYVPNQSARTLSSGQSRTFAAITANFTNPWVSELLNEFEIQCAHHGYDAIFASVGLDAGRTTATLRRMIERQVDGIAIFVSQMDADSAALLLRNKVPVCGLSYSAIAGVYPIFKTDYKPGIEQAIAHLKKLGHKEIAFISGPLNEFTATLRVDVFRMAMAAANLRVSPELVREGDWRMQGGIAAAQALLESPRRFTAVLCSNDATAIGAMRCLRQAKLRVPQDISVIGVDDLDSAQFADPPLTTIRIPRREIVQLAVSGLVAASQKGKPQPRETVMPTSLVIRESTGRASKRS